MQVEVVKERIAHETAAQVRLETEQRAERTWPMLRLQVNCAAVPNRSCATVTGLQESKTDTHEFSARSFPTCGGWL